MKFFSKALLFIQALFSHTADVSVSEPVSTGAVTTQTTTVTASPAEVLEEDVQHAIDIVTNVRNALASPVAVLITGLIPGTVDDQIREALVNQLPVEIAGLTFFKNLLATSDKSAQFNELLARIKFSDTPYLDAFYHTLAARVLMIVSGGKVSWSNAVMAVEYFFTHSLVGAPAEAAAAVAVVA